MNERYFELAKKQSLKSNHHTFNIGAVIVKKNHVVSFGYNILKTHPRSNKKFKSIHAEFMAINNARNEESLKNAEIYVYRENALNNLALSKPCFDCLELIKRCGIRKINYTIDNGYAEERV